MIVFPAYDQTGTPLAGLSPSWHVIVDASTGLPVGTPPAISDLGDGLYRIENGIFVTSAGLIDLGATALPRYLHLDSDANFTLGAYNVTLTPLTGLTPTWDVFIDAATGLPLSAPTITELGSGLYRINYDSDADPAAGILDLGATAVPRYYAFTMDVSTPVGPPVLSALDAEDGGIGFELRTAKARL